MAIVGKLNPGVQTTLDNIPKTQRAKTPAEATLEDGGRIPCTLFLEISKETDNEYFDPIGMLRLDYSPNEEMRKKVIMPGLVSSVTESQYRTPIAIEEKMYQSEFHEIFMGAPFLCKIVLDDGTEFLMNSSTWETEFIVLPDDISNTRIIDVVPLDYISDFHRLQDAKKELPDPGVMYCLFIR